MPAHVHRIYTIALHVYYPFVSRRHSNEGFSSVSRLDWLQIPDHINRHEAAEFVFLAKTIRPLVALDRDANNAIPGVQHRPSAVAAKNDRIDHEVRNLVVHLALCDRAMVNVDAVAMVVSRKTEQRNRLADLRETLWADLEFQEK